MPRSSSFVPMFDGSIVRLPSIFTTGLLLVIALHVLFLSPLWSDIYDRVGFIMAQSFAEFEIQNIGWNMTAQQHLQESTGS